MKVPQHEVFHKIPVAVHVIVLCYYTGPGATCIQYVQDQNNFTSKIQDKLQDREHKLQWKSSTIVVRL